MFNNYNVSWASFNFERNFKNTIIFAPILSPRSCHRETQNPYNRLWFTPRNVLSQKYPWLGLPPHRHLV